MEFDRFNFGVRDVGIDRRTRELGSWYQMAKHIGDDWKLDEPTKECIDSLIRDIKMGKVTEKDELSVGQINEFKKALNKMYHSREQGDDCYLKHNDPDYNGSDIATYTYSSRNNSVDPETVLRPEDVAKLVEGASRPRDKAYIMLMWSTSARVGETLALKWKDVQITRIKGNRMAKVRIKETNSSEDEKTNTRNVPIREGYTFIKKLKQSDPISDNPDAFIFRRVKSVDPDDQLSHTGASNIVSRALRNIKDREDIDWNPNRKTNNHNFRHSRATFWASQGMNESQIRSLGGWSDSSDTVKQYIHLGKEDVEGAVLDFHGLESQEREEAFTLEPVVCPRCNHMNPFNAEICQENGCDETISMQSQSKEVWIDDTAKEVAFSIANSSAGVEQDEIEKQAEELVQQKIEEGEIPQRA
jgi:integrase/ribosomal protein L40E